MITFIIGCLVLLFSIQGAYIVIKNTILLLKSLILFIFHFCYGLILNFLIVPKNLKSHTTKYILFKFDTETCYEFRCKLCNYYYLICHNKVLFGEDITCNEMILKNILE